MKWCHSNFAWIGILCLYEVIDDIMSGMGACAELQNLSWLVLFTLISHMTSVY